MSIQAVQVFNPEVPVAQARRRAPADTASSGAQAPSSGPVTPQDAVVVSDQARMLAAAGASQDGPRLQLDFKQLRELAFAQQAAKPEE
jgi:hypothetical protein